MSTAPTEAAPLRAFYTPGDRVFKDWYADLCDGDGPVLYPHAFPYPEIGPGLVTVIGGPPGGGKTALVTQMGIEMLRASPQLRVVMANCEMAPSAILNRQLARLSGIDAETIRHRRFLVEHEERLAIAIATIESFIDRLAFMDAPYDIRNVAATADSFSADVVIVDYIQRFTVPTEDVEARHRVNRTMDYLRQFAKAGVAVIVISAVGRSRDRAGRSSYSGEGLSLASFRETSELEYGADDALILAPADEREPDRMRLSHLKARHGRQVTQEFIFNRSVQSFTPVTEVPAAEKPSEKVAGGGSRSARRVSISSELQRMWDTSHAAADQDKSDEHRPGDYTGE